MANNNQTPEKKPNFWAPFFRKEENESNSNPRYRIAELITENRNLKKQIAKIKEEYKVLQSEAESAKSRAISYAAIVEHQNDQINEFKERFQYDI